MSVQGLREILAAIKQDGGDVGARFKLLALSKKNGSKDLILYAIGAVLEVEPTNFWVNLDLIKLLSEEQSMSQAVKKYNELFALANNEAETAYVYFWIAKFYEGRKDLIKADSAYCQAIKAYSQDPYLFTEYAKFLRSLPEENIPMIVDSYEKALALSPKDIWISDYLREYRLKQSDNIAEVKSLANVSAEFVRSHSDNVSPLQLQRILTELKLVNLRLTANENREVRAYASKCELELLNSCEQYRILAEYFYSLAEFNGDSDIRHLKCADYYFRRYISLADSLEQSSAVRSLQVMFKLEQLQDGKELALSLLKLFPENMDIWLWSGRIFYGLNFLGAARLLLGKYLAEKPYISDHIFLTEVVSAHKKANAAKSKKFRNIDDLILSFDTDSTSVGISRERGGAICTINWLYEFFQRTERFDISYIFDYRVYSNSVKLNFQNTDDALVHYMSLGRQSAAKWHPVFDSKFIIRQLQRYNIYKPDEPLLLQYLRYELQYDLSPSVLFEPAMYRQAIKSPVTGSAWIDYAKGGWREAGDISSYFNSSMYVERSRFFQDDGDISPLQLCLTKGYYEDCNTLFHMGFYAKVYNNFVGEEYPLVHYLCEGIYIGFHPNPFCDIESLSIPDRRKYLTFNKG